MEGTKESQIGAPSMPLLGALSGLGDKEARRFLLVAIRFYSRCPPHPAWPVVTSVSVCSGGFPGQRGLWKPGLKLQRTVENLLSFIQLLSHLITWAAPTRSPTAAGSELPILGVPNGGGLLGTPGVFPTPGALRSSTSNHPGKLDGAISTSLLHIGQFGNCQMAAAHEG